MKNIIRSMITLFFMLMIISPVYPQGNFYNYTNAGISFWYPDNWQLSEHVLLLLMPKAKDLSISFQITEEVNLDEAVNASKNEIKNIYPDDSLIIVKDYTINTIKVREINEIIDTEKIYRLLLETPDGKILKIFFNCPNEKALKYNSDVQKIIKSLQPIKQ